MRRFFLLSLLVSAAFAADRNECPWINTGTAAGIIGHTVEKKTATPNSCEFADAHSVYVLQIEVKEGEDLVQSCSSRPQSLPAIGNRAFSCEKRSGHGQRVECVFGGVRDQTFVITVKTTASDVTEASLRQKAKRAAEQVVGNLF